MSMNRFTTKRESQKRNSDFSFANERREQTQRHSHGAGFTLIETMIAVAILTLSVAGPLFTADRAIVAAQLASNQLTASYLAQEGIEYVRAMRDGEFLAAYRTGGQNVSTTAWNAFLANSPASDSFTISGCRMTTVCTLDPVMSAMGTGSGLSLLPCSGASCTPLYLANGVYTERTNLGGTATPFRRTIQAIDVSGTDERIESKVWWTSHGTTYTVTVTDHLTPWQ